MPFVRVLFEPVRSAEPPTVSAVCALMTSSAISDALRVATLGLSAISPVRYSAIASSSEAGSSPAIAASNSALCGEASRRFCQSSRAPDPRDPALRQSETTSSGSSNGAWSQPTASRTPAISSSPVMAPCAFAVPASVGAPKPMTVLQAIIDGRSDIFALSMAALTASMSCPSTSITSHPAAVKRVIWSIEVDRLVAPSMVMPLSSKRTMSLDSLRCPARSMASWLTPSIRQPSPAKT